MMYMNPFLCGVLATIFVEVVGVLVYALYSVREDDKAMKQPKKLTRRQREIVGKNDLDWRDWSLVKEYGNTLVVQNKDDKSIKTITY